IASCRSDQREIEAKTEQNRSTLADRLGWEDFFSLNVWRASTAELLGTAVLVFMVEAIIISIHETDIDAPKLIMAILIAITVAMLVLATIPVSGGHINPIVSFSAGLMGLISLSRTAIYIFAQSAGGVLGALALKAVVDSSTSPGGCTTASRLEKGRALCLEIICSFVFLFASRWIAFDPRQAKVVGRVIVCLGIGASAGLNVFVSSTVTGSSAAGINPARCLGAAMVRGGHLWDGHWVFWAGPAIASMVFCLYTRIIPDDHFRPKVKEHGRKS
ncbi:aquaporin TIP3-2-like, partial [Diospyros lotus]|uniref:aquaporin TIP3-2-like n=1 Tax=Diospyros lotus TaxID=55363 RepID=UPI0022500E6D